MRPGILMLALLLGSACIPALGLFTTPVFSIALITGIACSVAGYIVFRLRPMDPVLFLLAQPFIFLSWYIFPILSFVLESALALALLFSLGLLHSRKNLALPALFLMAMAIVTVLLSTMTHVFLPIFLFIPAMGLICLGILGLAYRTTIRPGGGTT